MLYQCLPIIFCNLLKPFQKLSSRRKLPSRLKASLRRQTACHVPPSSKASFSVPGRARGNREELKFVKLL